MSNKLEEDPFSLISLNWDTLLDYYLYNACFQAEEEIKLDYFILDDIINLIPNEQKEIKKTISESIKNIAVSKHEKADNGLVKLIKII